MQNPFGRADQQPHDVCLEIRDIVHRTTRVRRPQSNGNLERFHFSLPDAHCRAEGRRTWLETMVERQAVLANWQGGFTISQAHDGQRTNGHAANRALSEDQPNSKHGSVISQIKIIKLEAA